MVNRTLALFAALCVQCAVSTATASDGCLGTPRIDDDQAIAITKAELKRRSPRFDLTAFKFSVREDGCALRVHIEDKRGLGILVLTRSGDIKQYLGPM
jgi:hypothetical protein